MGSHLGELTALALCFVGMVVVVQQGGVLMSNSNLLKSQEKDIVARAVPAMATHFCVLTKQELESLPSPSSSSSSSSTSVPLASPTPILDLMGESLTAAVPVVSEHLSQQVIAAVVVHAGFFPSNVMQTLQSLLEYNSNVMTTSVSVLLQNIAGSYYYFGNKTYNDNYFETGVFAQELSQIFATVASVPQLTQNTNIATQDSWLGNFVVSFPNIAYQTSMNTTSWTEGFSNAAQLAHNLGEKVWQGTYYSGNDPDQGRVHWVCYQCDKVFNEIGNQAAILAVAPFDPEDLEEKAVVEVHR